MKLARGNEGIGSITIAEYARLAELPEEEPPPPETGALKLTGKITVKGKKMRVSLRCPAQFSGCLKAGLVVRGRGKVRGMKNPLLAKGRKVTVESGKTRAIKLKLTGKARKIFRNAKQRKRGKMRIRKGAKKVKATVTINGKKTGPVVVRRSGRVR